MPAAPVRTLGILGDIHAEDARLATTLAHLSIAGVDRIVATGDVVDGHGDVNACCTLLMQHQVLAVRGNHERWLHAGTMRHLPQATPAAELTSSSAEYLNRLPTTLLMVTLAGSMMLCHGTDGDDMAAVRTHDTGYALESNTALQRILTETAHAVMLSGHTHRRMVRALQTPRELLLINAGTLFREHNPCFGFVDFVARQVHYFDI
jgi:predicted phosphodiesterase